VDITARYDDILAVQLGINEADLKAYYYNPKKKIELEKVLAPPHDVISPEERIGFQKKSPYNIIYLILPDSYQKQEKYSMTLLRIR
jgi:uncharacterized protein (DUF1015 family)